MLRCLDITCHPTCIPTRNSRPFSVGQPTSSLVPFFPHSIPVLSGIYKSIKDNKIDKWLQAPSAFSILLIPVYQFIPPCRTPLINLEDVFLTGLCARKQLGLKLTNNKKFIARGPSSVGGNNICVFKKAVVVHNKYKPVMLDKLWRLTTQKKSSCYR